MNHADLIVLGGGCAGLSLASHLALRWKQKRVVVFEARKNYFEDRTWCGWRIAPHLFDDCASAEWNRWRLVTPLGDFERRSEAYPYQRIGSGEFYRKACELIRENDADSIRMGVDVEDVAERDDAVTVCLSNGEAWDAPYVVDTRPQTRTLGWPWMWQNFVGYVVRIEQGQPFGDVPTLMDFQTAGAGCIQFMYIIPLRDNSYLCEWTRFSLVPDEQAEIESELMQWIKTRIPGSWTLAGREAGSLPMAPPLKNSGGPRVIPGGTRGGSMRAATGYAFHSIQRWAEACAMSIEAGNAPIAPARNRVLEAMDRLFLSVLRERPAEAAALFGRLFYKCDPDPLIRFLAGVPRVGDFWPVVNALPKRRFLRALPALSRADFSSNGALS